jgi:ubiquinone/menaquinone biosynthesis C-methylase UbiE
MFRNRLETRVPLNTDRYMSIDKAREYDRVASRNSLLYPMQRVVGLAEPYCKPNQTIVNLGCETGILSIVLSGKTGFRITGIDDNPFFIQVAEENENLARLSSYQGDVSFYVSPFTHLPLEDKFVDLLFADNFLSRTNDPLTVLRECLRVLKDDGVVILYQLIRDADINIGIQNLFNL